MWKQRTHRREPNQNKVANSAVARMSDEKLFLLIDILGFSELSSDSHAMDEIFERIDKLNVHKDRDFNVIAFSDTILIYASGGWLDYKSQAVMWLLEFAQDLFYRFVGIDRHFRAYLTIGEFTFSTKNNIDAYYGPALVECAKKEKQIKASGVFIANALTQHSDVFHTTPYDDDCHYVHVMQRLDNISWPDFDKTDYPLDPILIDGTDLDWLIAYDIVYIKNVYRHMSDDILDGTVREKYSNTWKMIYTRHAALLDTLESANFDPNAICVHDWAEPMRRVSSPDGFFS